MTASQITYPISILYVMLALNQLNLVKLSRGSDFMVLAKVESYLSIVVLGARLAGYHALSH